ncbi:hypothetical protein [Bradyrhizobium stylosanthis]|uniref:hypothetical protein n=1 Tax=Bradyrhizobium stylosanthis TaxID=1803665 RepID=UPI0012E8F009|nr:hypothetical protein [Bradyrhizobium stylosanthis]
MPTSMRVVAGLVGMALCAFAHPTALRRVACTSSHKRDAPARDIDGIGGEGDSVAGSSVLIAKPRAFCVSKNLQLWTVIFAKVSR